MTFRIRFVPSAFLSLFLIFSCLEAQAQTFPLYFGFNSHRLEGGLETSPGQLANMQAYTERWYADEARSVLLDQGLLNGNVFSLVQLYWMGLYQRETRSMGTIEAQTDQQVSLTELLEVVKQLPAREVALKVVLRVLGFSEVRSPDTPLLLSGASFVWRDATGAVQAEWPFLRYLHLHSYQGGEEDAEEADTGEMTALRLLLDDQTEIVKFLGEKKQQNYAPQRLELVFVGTDDVGQTQEHRFRLPSFSHVLEVLYNQMPSRQRWDISPCAWFLKSGTPNQSESP